MNIDKLVPPLELCKKIPQGEFGDSVFVWSTQIDLSPFVKVRSCHSFSTVYPAPTLQEIMSSLSADPRVCNIACDTAKDGIFWLWVQIPWFEDVCGKSEFQFKSENAAEAALLVWTKTRGIEI